MTRARTLTGLVAAAAFALALAAPGAQAATDRPTA